MTLTATLLLATAVALAVTVALLAAASRRDPRARRSWVHALAQLIVETGLRNLPPDQRERYHEECGADLTQLGASPVRMVVHALQTAACGRRLMLTFGAAPARRRDALHRRVLAHLGLPVRLADPPESADAAYVFGGAMRSRRSTEGRAGEHGL
jgi:hypothetical protein